VSAFDDLNGNWLRDSGEPLLAGAHITVRNPALAPIGQYTTDGIAEPRCFALAPGAYYVDEVDPPGYASRAPNLWGVVVTSQTSLAVAFADERSTGTFTPTVTATPQVGSTATPSATASVSPTMLPSATASASPTPTASATSGFQGTATSTATPTATPRLTATPTASRTPTGGSIKRLYLPLILGR